MIPMDMGIMDLLDLYKYKNKRCRQKTTDFDTITIIIYENLKKGEKNKISKRPCKIKDFRIE